MLLSLGWQLSAFRIYGGTLHDTAALAGNLMKGQGGNITERMIFTMWYTAINAGIAAGLTYMANKFWGGGGDPIPKAGPEGFFGGAQNDYLFPRVGKDANGQDKRVSPVEFTREWATWKAHIEAQGLFMGTVSMAANKANPVLNTIWDVVVANKNFYGQQIRDPNDNALQQMGDAVKFAMINSLPIPVEGLLDKTGQNYTWVDVAYSSL